MAIVFFYTWSLPKEWVSEGSTIQVEAGYFSQWATKKSGKIMNIMCQKMAATAYPLLIDNTHTYIDKIDR